MLPTILSVTFDGRSLFLPLSAHFLTGPKRMAQFCHPVLGDNYVSFYPLTFDQCGQFSQYNATDTFHRHLGLVPEGVHGRSLWSESLT